VEIATSDDGRVVGTAYATTSALYLSAIDFSLPLSSLSLPNATWPLTGLRGTAPKIRLFFDVGRYGIEPFPFVVTVLQSVGGLTLVRYSASVTTVVEMAALDGMVNVTDYDAHLRSDGRAVLIAVANASHSALYSLDLAAPSPILLYQAVMVAAPSAGEKVTIALNPIDQVYCFDSITAVNSSYAYFYVVECVWPALGRSDSVAIGLRTSSSETVRYRRLQFLHNGLLCFAVSFSKSGDPSLEPFFFARCLAPLDFVDSPITISLSNSYSVGSDSPAAGIFSARSRDNSSMVCATAVLASGNTSSVMHSCGPGVPPSDYLASYSLTVNSSKHDFVNSNSVLDSTGSWYAPSIHDIIDAVSVAFDQSCLRYCSWFYREQGQFMVLCRPTSLNSTSLSTYVDNFVSLDAAEHLYLYESWIAIGPTGHVRHCLQYTIDGLPSPPFCRCCASCALTCPCRLASMRRRCTIAEECPNWLSSTP